MSAPGRPVSPVGEWPAADLEPVPRCPVCDHAGRERVHEGVADWSFGAAPGLWAYHRCSACQTLYLDPRPTPGSIGRAYQTYYTHTGVAPGGGWRDWKRRWRNERLSARLQRPLEPRLNLPSWLQPWVAGKGHRIALPFGWDEIAAMAPGRLMDMGCGSGATLAFAAGLGWSAQGIEFDPVAVQGARSAGLDVQVGGPERLAETPETFDAILCSHVIEHVHRPREMIAAMRDALKPGGVLLLSTPNALSDVHRHFGRHWRGLEAPRHLMLFSEATLRGLLEAAGLVVESRSDAQLETLRESARIARGDTRVRSVDRALARRLARELPRTPTGQDFIKLQARRV